MEKCSWSYYVSTTSPVQMDVHRFFVLCWFGLQVFADTEIKAEAGDDVLLHCQTSRGSNIELIKLIRPDLESDGYVVFSRENRTYEEYQHSYFHGRVELRDVETMNLSVILKDVTVNDTGSYQWYVAYEDSSELFCTNNLTVITSGDTNKELGDGVTTALVVVVVVVVVAVVLFFIKSKTQNQDCVV